MKSHNQIQYAIGFIWIVLTVLPSCKKDFQELNTPFHDVSAENATIPGLFNGLAKSETDEDYTLAVSLFYPITNQQGVQNVLTPYLNYIGSLWSKYYPSLYNYRILLKKISANADSSSYNNVKYMANILMAAKTLHMLDYYGDMPYSNAAKADESINYFRVAYDDQAAVYHSVLADLKAAADGLKDSPDQINIGASESFLNNNIDSWIKFANALRLRYAVRLYDKDQATATDIINDIVGGNRPLPDHQNPASLQNDNFGSWIGQVTVSGDPYVDRFWYAFRETSVSNMRMGTNIWKQMSSNNDASGTGIFDPRIYVYFQTNNADKWVPQPQDRSIGDGGQPYKNGLTERQPIGSDPDNKFSCFNFSMVHDYQNFPYLIITEADVHFLKAEIYQRGMGVGKNIGLAKTEYEAGITSSVDFWYAYASNSSGWTVKPTAPNAIKMAAFLTNPAVLYNGANNADALKKIAIQSWLATVYEPAEAWAIARRTGLVPKDPTANVIQVNKLPYPDDERINNNENWTKASGGADFNEQALTKVYWMP